MSNVEDLNTIQTAEAPQQVSTDFREIDVSKPTIRFSKELTI